MKIRLKEIMQERGVTSIALASMVGLSKNTISNLINNKTMPSIDTLNEIAKKLNVPFWQLFAEPQTKSFSAIIDYNGMLKKVTSISELKTIITELENAGVV